MLLMLYVDAILDSYSGIRSVEQDAEMMRLQVLGNPHLMNQLRQVCSLALTSYYHGV